MTERPADPAADLRPPADDAEARALLLEGEIDLEGRMLDASNVTLVGYVRTGELVAECVYKPVAGERPLWDFPDGTLAGREVSAYLVSQATGWNLIPPTILRDGPLGVGACQLWIDEPDDAEALIGFVPAYDVPQGWLPVASARDEDGGLAAVAASAEHAQPALRHVLRRADVDALALVVGVHPDLHHARAERPVAQHGGGHDVEPGGLGHQVGADLAPGQGAVGEVPQRPLAAHRLVDALRLQPVERDGAEQGGVGGVDQPAGDVDAAAPDQVRHRGVARVHAGRGYSATGVWRW